VSGNGRRVRAQAAIFRRLSAHVLDRELAARLEDQAAEYLVLAEMKSASS